MPSVDFVPSDPVLTNGHLVLLAMVTLSTIRIGLFQGKHDQNMRVNKHKKKAELQFLFAVQVLAIVSFNFAHTTLSTF